MPQPPPRGQQNGLPEGILCTNGAYGMNVPMGAPSPVYGDPFACFSH
ncbi:MAG TPA: hypothetical protein VKV26_21550 [Dehalococcoidia bacterium]|nr:hypothetical protein [Dehalococcoidia bacterium]